MFPYYFAHIRAQFLSHLRKSAEVRYALSLFRTSQYTKAVPKSRAVSSARMHETSTHWIFQTFHSRDLSD